MTLFRRFLSRLNSFRIGDGHHAEPFFIRYDLIKTRWFSIYLHEFLRSDADRCLHDHPWPFLTIILRGGYFEQTDIREYWRPPGYIGWYSATHRHRISVSAHKPLPWSLVIVGRKIREWGFWGPDGFKAWRANEPNPICETEHAQTSL